ncbi:MAG TPA: hypothetical protein VK576_10995 [Thermoleophilia bacterium]|nr:hypothetical protein [Thermoleophilia bacterium]
MQIVGDDALTRSGIAGLLAGREDILVVGQLEPAAIDEAPALEADVVAWDVARPSARAGRSSFPGRIFRYWRCSGTSRRPRRLWLQAHGAHSCAT